jgi:hypothetical protein
MSINLVFVKHENKLEAEPGATVKLLPCDKEVMGSSPGNSLLQKCKERLRTSDPKWSDSSPDAEQVGATCTGLPFYSHMRAACHNLF